METFEHRGYSLFVIFWPPAWQVHISPTRTSLPVPAPALQFVEHADKHRALALARQRVDEELSASLAEMMVA